MGSYQDDMSAEKRPPTLLPEGERRLIITEMIEQTSKKGNRMFMTTVEDVGTKKSMTVYLVAEPKKRWLLKSLLSACEIPAGQDGIYDWSITDVIGKTVIGMVEHYEEEWTNRDNETVKTKKANITEFIKYTPNSDSGQPSQVDWNE